MERLEPPMSGSSQALGVHEPARLRLRAGARRRPELEHLAPVGRIEFRLLRAHVPGDRLDPLRAMASERLEIVQPAITTAYTSTSTHYGRAAVRRHRRCAPPASISISWRFRRRAARAPSLPYARSALILDVPARSQYVVPRPNAAGAARRAWR